MTLIPKPLSFFASSTSKISPGLRSVAETFLEFTLFAVFDEEESFIYQKKKKREKETNKTKRDNDLPLEQMFTGKTLKGGVLSQTQPQGVHLAKYHLVRLKAHCFNSSIPAIEQV